MIVRYASTLLAAALLVLSLCQTASAAGAAPVAADKPAHALDGTQLAMADVSHPVQEAEAVQHDARHAPAEDQAALTEPGALAVAGAGLFVLLLAGRRRAGSEAFADKR